MIMKCSKDSMDFAYIAFSGTDPTRNLPIEQQDRFFNARESPAQRS